VTIADIVKRAGIARNTFYDNFSSKEDCFLAAQQHALESAIGRVVDAAEQVESWPERVGAGLAAFLGYVASEPALARTCMVEAFSAGPAAVKCYEESQEAFIRPLPLGRAVSPYGKNLPPTFEEQTVGGVFGVINRRVADDEAEQIEDLLP
jgi:AcrR family transcriptional regulator